jgi:tetratricopeptide (TPR) repeat protein
MPLALAQAGAYIRQTNISVHEYLEYYDSTWEDLIEEQDSYPLLEYAQRSMLTTWTISYQQVERQNMGAAKLLQLWAYLDPKDMWYELLACAIDLQSQIEIPEWLSTLVKSRLKFRSAFGLLKKYSLVNDGTDAANYSMHAVLHSWCRHLASISGMTEAFPELAVSIVAQMVPDKDNEKGWILWKRLFPHGQQLLSYLRLGTAWRLSHVPVGAYGKTAKLFEHNYAFEEAAELLESAVEETERDLGQDHVSTLDAFRKLARIYSRMGRDGDPKSEKLYERALAGCEKAVGLDPTNSADVSRRISNVLLACGQPPHIVYKTPRKMSWILNMVYFAQDKSTDVDEVSRRALAEFNEFYHETDHHVNILSKQLSEVHCELDRRTEEKKMAEGLSVAETFVLGSDRTLEDRLILCRRQGKHAEAEVMAKRALVETEKMFGAEHMETLRVEYQLAMCYAGQSDKLQEARTLYEQMIPRFRKTFGLDENATQTVIQALGTLYYDKLDMLSEAEELFKQTLETSERLWGPNHEKTLTAVHNLACVYRSQGDRVREVETRRRVLVACENTVGIEHQRTIDAALHLDLALRRPHGYFSLTSQNIMLDSDCNLVAFCARIDRSLARSTLSLNNILENVYGHFRWGGRGKFIATARNLGLKGNGRLLVADLGDGRGGWNHSTIRLDEGIGNSDGELIFMNPWMT